MSSSIEEIRDSKEGFYFVQLAGWLVSNAEISSPELTYYYLSFELVVKQKQISLLYVPVTVHREQSGETEYQQDATIRMFIVNFRCLLSNTVSTCFGHHYAHHQENKDRVLLHMVLTLVVLDVTGCCCGVLRCRVQADVPAPYNATPHNCNQSHPALPA